MLTLYITRHGETEWNLEKRMQGWSDSPLTAKGIENARELGLRLKDTEFEAIYSSPIPRALLTAQTISAEREIPIVMDDKLREIHMGEWEGKDQSFLTETYAAEYSSFWKTPHLYTSATGENFKELQERVIEAVETIKTLHQKGNVLIVTHSIVIKALMAYFKGNSLNDLWLPPFIHGTSLTIVELDEDRNSIVLEGDMAHVEKLQEQNVNG